MDQTLRRQTRKRKGTKSFHIYQKMMGKPMVLLGVFRLVSHTLSSLYDCISHKPAHLNQLFPHLTLRHRVHGLYERTGAAQFVGLLRERIIPVNHVHAVFLDDFLHVLRGI